MEYEILKANTHGSRSTIYEVLGRHVTLEDCAGAGSIGHIALVKNSLFGVISR